MPEKRSLAILIVDQAKLEQSIHPSEAELRRVYLNDQDKFRTPERVKARHILLKTTDKSPAEEAKSQDQGRRPVEADQGRRGFRGTGAQEFR